MEAHVSTKENPADHGTRGLNPEEIPAKRLTAQTFLYTKQLSVPDNSSKHVLATHETSRSLSEQIIDSTRFSNGNKLLLTLATVFNLVFRIKKQRSKDQQYITEDVILARNRLIKMLQPNNPNTETWFQDRFKVHNPFAHPNVGQQLNPSVMRKIEICAR